MVSLEQKWNSRESYIHSFKTAEECDNHFLDFVDQTLLTPGVIAYDPMVLQVGPLIHTNVVSWQQATVRTIHDRIVGRIREVDLL